MGLLGDGWQDPQSQGLLALSGGMLNGSMGDGVNAMNQMMITAPQRQLQLMNLQLQLQQQQRFNSILGQLSGGAQQPGQPSQPSGAQLMQQPIPAPGVMGSGTMDPNNPILPPQSATQTATQSAPQGAQGNPGLFMGMPRDQALWASLGGLKGLSDAGVKATATPDPIRVNDVLGLSRPEQAAAVRRELAAKGLINVRPGGSVLDSSTQQPIFTAPQGGIQINWGANGPLASIVPGEADAAATMAKATAGATATGKTSAINALTIAPSEYQKTLADGTHTAYTWGQLMTMATQPPNAAPTQTANFPATPDAPQPGATASLTGDPRQLFAQLAGIKDPAERVAALAAYRQQLAQGPSAQTVSAPATSAPQPASPAPAVTPQGFGAPAGLKTGLEGQQTVLAAKWSALQADASQAQTTISYLQDMKAQAKKAALGPLADKLDFANGLLSFAGISDRATNAVTANDLLEKYSNQITMRLGAGGLGTDAARTIIHSAFPNQSMNLPAFNEAADNLIGANNMTKAKLVALQKYGNSNDPIGYQQTEQTFNLNADPRIWRIQGMTPQEQKLYIQGDGTPNNTGLPIEVRKQIREQRGALIKAGVLGGQ